MEAKFIRHLFGAPHDPEVRLSVEHKPAYRGRGREFQFQLDMRKFLRESGKQRRDGGLGVKLVYRDDEAGFNVIAEISGD